MLINLRNALMTGKRLPYDAEVEYLESMGTQWINTGITPTPSDTVRIVADLALTSINTGDNNIVFGSYIETPTVRQFAFVDRTAKARIAYVGAASGTVTVAASTDYLFEAQFAPGNSYLNVNGATSSQNTSTATVLPTQPMALFACRYADSVISPSSMRLRSCKIYLNNLLVRDYIPVRKGTTGELYDRVSGKLFGNAGTGDFVLGQDVVPVEWLEATGTQYINTGKKLTSDDVVDITASRTNNNSFFGSSETNKWFNITVSSGRTMFRFGATANSAPRPLDGQVSTMSCGKKWIVDGVEVAEPSGDFVGSYDCVVFARNGTAVTDYLSGRVYKFSITTNGTKVMGLLPVRVGTEGAMMDVLTRRIYRNAGTGAFTFGNDLKYPIPAS